jgi:nicotinamidase-related amidase
MASFYERPKNVLLIIDPQRDFTDKNIDGTSGSLQVPGAAEDYKRIIAMLDKVTFDEIHVSLDTHTKNHIGHPGFWRQTNREAIPNTIYMLDIDKDKKDVITGVNILRGLEIPKPDGTTIKPFAEMPDITVEPDNISMRTKPYVKEYLRWFNGPNNKHGQRCYIWFEHCIEGTPGHKIYEPLQEKLNEIRGKQVKVKYHIKGQNNLAEMYSIFSAENPVSKDNMVQYNELIYDVDKRNTKKDGSSDDTYEGVIQKVNLKTELNTDLLNELLGTPENQNKVYICGEARTHCVKSSVIDLLEYADKKKYDQQNIIFIKDCSSPIGGAPNDIIFKVTGIKDVEDEAKTGATGYDSGKGYTARAIDSTEVITELAPPVIKKGGKRTKRNKKIRATKKQSAGKKNKSRRYRRKMTKHNM